MTRRRTFAGMAAFAVLLSACGRSAPSAPTKPGDFVLLVALADSRDGVTIRYVSRLLEARGIPYSAGGSIGVLSFVVPPDSLDEAKKVLRQEAGLRGYLNWGTDGPGEPGEKVERKTVEVDAEFERALVTYDENTVVGRLLRSPHTAQCLRTERASRIESVSWEERAFVTKALKSSKAIEGVVVLGLRGAPGAPERTECRVTLVDDEMGK